jgi:hypothetical protein
MRSLFALRRRESANLREALLSTIVTTTAKTRGNSGALWVLLIAVINVVHLWLFFNLPDVHGFQFWVTITIHAIGTLGPFWMLSHWFIKRRMKLRWERWMWLAFVPWGFLWYAFEKYEPAVSELDMISARDRHLR